MWEILSQREILKRKNWTILANQILHQKISAKNFLTISVSFVKIFVAIKLVYIGAKGNF